MWPKEPLCKELSYSSKNKRGFIRPKGRYGVGKRGTLEENSSLGLKGIDMSHVNLNRLISGKSCTIPYTLFRNRY